MRSQSVDRNLQRQLVDLLETVLGPSNGEFRFVNARKLLEVFGVFRKMTGSAWRSAMIAACSPLHARGRGGGC